MLFDQYRWFLLSSSLAVVFDWQVGWWLHWRLELWLRSQWGGASGVAQTEGFSAQEVGQSQSRHADLSNWQWLWDLQLPASELNKQTNICTESVRVTVRWVFACFNEAEICLPPDWTCVYHPDVTQNMFLMSVNRKILRNKMVDAVQYINLTLSGVILDLVNCWSFILFIHWINVLLHSDQDILSFSCWSACKICPRLQ